MSQLALRVAKNIFPAFADCDFAALLLIRLAAKGGDPPSPLGKALKMGRALNERSYRVIKDFSPQQHLEVVDLKMADQRTARRTASEKCEAVSP